MSLSSLIIICSVSGIIIGFAIVASVSIYKERKKNGYYSGEEKDGKPHGKGTLYYGNISPISHVKSDTWKNGKYNGKVQFFIKDKDHPNDKNKEKSVVFDAKNGFLLKTINNEKSKKIACLAFNNAIGTNASDILHSIDYQKKYGVFQSIKSENLEEDITKFNSKLVAKQSRISGIKIMLINHGGEKGVIDEEVNGDNVKYIIEELAKQAHELRKNVYIVNFACHSAEEYTNNVNDINLIEIIKNVAAKYTDISFFYAHHNAPTLAHSVLKTYDENKNMYGLKHFTLQYKKICNDKTIHSLTKEEKNQAFLGI